MNILFSIDERFVEPMLTTLYSIRINNPQPHFDIFVLQKQPLAQNQRISQWCEAYQMTYHPILIDAEAFQHAPVLKHWNETIYYRLLAHDYLPHHLERVLYLDADILCINALDSLYDLEMGANYYAGASYGRLINETREKFNRLRLQNPQLEEYINTGVLLINLEACRQNVSDKVIFDYIEANRRLLLLPDQDVLNGLYGAHIHLIPDEIYNYDVRYPKVYELFSEHPMTAQRVMQETVFLHYCGKDKPWNAKTNNDFNLLYLHYQAKREQQQKLWVD